MSAFLRGAWPALLFLLGLLSLSDAAFMNFENCLDENILNSDPLQLQWTPLWLDARFGSPGSPNNLSVVIYGNVSGQQVQGEYPPPDSDQWSDDDDKFGKIGNTGLDGEVYSTLLANFKVLTYEAYNAPGREFCPNLLNASCPLGPVFDPNANNPSDFPAFYIEHDFGSAYSFSTLAATIRIISGEAGQPDLACVSANITPDLGNRITGLITWLPAVILILKGLATLYAAIWSPWGSSDIYRWSSNYGRDEDLLRLVTPGFGDCLQYIQFATLLGSLTLNYPGFFQPALTQTAWSLLLFNYSFVSDGPGHPSLRDGVYVTNGTYGFTQMRQLIGMSESEDVWACMAIWLLVIAAALVLLCQLGFFGRWLYRKLSRTPEEDLQQKNIPFTLGNMIRLMFNYFILPIVALSLFQLVISTQSPTSVVVPAVILLVILIISAAWILKVIFSTKPRTHLFDDMPTVLLYGPLYNTYSDSAAPFALVPVLITFMRSVAFGAVQPSGVAQIIILAICEVILILTLNGFRPFQNLTSMNLYHTAFAVVRLVTVLLCIAFVPTLGITEAPKGWIGYVILLLHACVLVFGFFLNAAQTIVEVAARSFGIAGHDAQTGAVRGSILNWRMLKKRQDRPNTGDRGSMTSDAAILRDARGVPSGSYRDGNRSRSISASSQQLLNRAGTPSMHRLSGFENFSTGGDMVGTSAAGDLDSPQAVGFAGAAANGKDKSEFYRPPRKRTATIDAMAPGVKSRNVGSIDPPYADSPRQSSGAKGELAKDGSGIPRKDSPAPAYFRDRSDSTENAPHTDYAVREVDQYYRGEALSGGQPTRKLKTGPADPQSPAANAHSWFQRMMFGVKGSKSKDTSKGFEVVRSSRIPSGMQQPPKDGVDGDVEMQTSPNMHQEPYSDAPEGQVGAGGERAVGALGQSGGKDHFGGTSRGLDETDERDYGGGGFAAYRGTRRRPNDRSTESPGADARDNYAPARAVDRSGSRQTRPREDSIENETDATGTHFFPNFDDSRPSYESSAAHSHAPRISADAPSDDDDGQDRFSHDLPPSHARQTSEVPSLNPIDPGLGDFDLPSRFPSRRSVAPQHDQNPGSGGSNDWLRSVDSLSWNHNTAAPNTNTVSTAPEDQATVRAVPSVPRRSSRRTSSADQATASSAFLPKRNPTQSPPATHDRRHPSGTSRFPAFDMDDGFGRGSGAGDRPESYLTNRSHHRAADSITRNSFGADVASRASRAEFLGGVEEGDGGDGRTESRESRGSRGSKMP